MNDQTTEVKVCEVDLSNADFMKKLHEVEQDMAKKWVEESTTKFAMKLLAHGEPEKDEIVKGLVAQTFEAGFKLGMSAFLAHAARNAKTIQPNGMGIPCPGVGQA